MARDSPRRGGIDVYDLKPCPRCGWAPRFETHPIVNNSYTEDGRRMGCLIRIRVEEV